MYRRLPKRGFKNRNTKEIIAVNVDMLNKFEDGADVTIESMMELGIISNPKDGVKILVVPHGIRKPVFENSLVYARNRDEAAESHDQQREKRVDDFCG